ncbi:demethoxyubiquinone hydroxylase family protein [Roseateles sp. BYS87W]|uniref:Demethoxyubiquinone hydroxylase family protein n=1 Tax=Pelomonas baiyunensis TaxID=3299026 RepID=A0ABW7GTH9_9BURK
MSAAARPGTLVAPDLLAPWHAALRTDQAGETGAVWIYRGMQAVTRDPALRAFAQRHLATEQAHLDTLNSWLPAAERSRLLPVWRVAGWLTGALPAAAGPRAAYATVAAVETFVEQHYRHQIEALPATGPLGALRTTLEACRQDEAHHRDEAAAQATRARLAPLAVPLPPLLRAWCALVRHGSAWAVRLTRHV